MTKPEREGQLSASRVAEYRCALGRQRDSKTRLHPSADVFDEELLVCGEPISIKDW
jgi:hypothetical protein